MANTMPTMLTIKETVAESGLSYDYIRKLCLRNEIVYRKSGNKYYVNRERFIEYLNKEKFEKI